MRKLLFVAAIFFLVSFKHPFYLSVTDLKYNPKDKAIQGSVKIFVNDLEGALKKINNKTIDLVNIKDSSQTKIMLKNYLSSRLILKVNGKVKIFELVGFEREEEAIWLYLEFKKCDVPKKVEVLNSILFESIAEQTNIVQVEVNNTKKSFKATNPDKDFVFGF